MFIFWNYIYDFFKQNKNLVCVWLLRNERTGSIAWLDMIMHILYCVENSKIPF